MPTAAPDPAQLGDSNGLSTGRAPDVPCIINIMELHPFSIFQKNAIALSNNRFRGSLKLSNKIFYYK